MDYGEGGGECDEINYIKLFRGRAYSVSFSFVLQPTPLTSCSCSTVISASHPRLATESNMSDALSVDSKYATKFRSNYLVRPDCISAPRLPRARVYTYAWQNAPSCSRFFAVLINAIN